MTVPTFSSIETADELDKPGEKMIESRVARQGLLKDTRNMPTPRVIAPRLEVIGGRLQDDSKGY